MSGLFGSRPAQSATPQRYNGIQIASSASGGCVPLLYGQQRVPFNLIWYGNFQSTPVSSSGGGKGGGGSQPTSYSYSAAFACALCEGPITAIYQVWNDKDQTTLSALGFTEFTGAGGQSVWSYLTSNYPAQAIPYDHLCYVAASDYLLGDSAAIPNITFECGGFLRQSGTAITFTAAPAANATSTTLTSAALSNGTWQITFSDYEVRSCTVSGTAVTWQGGLNNACTTSASAGGVYDADPAAMVLDYLTDPNHGSGFPASAVASLTGTNSYQSYCAAMGFFLSPLETTQRASSDFLKEIFQITNSDSVWSAGTLKIAPYCDATVSGNGVTYTPNLTPQYIFTNDDFVDVPKVTRIPIVNTYNHVRIEYLDRSNSYNTGVAEATDLGDIAINGERIMDTLNFHEICNSTTARTVAQLILQTNLYERNTIKFKVRPDYCLLEPMDYIGICDPINADGSGLGYGSVNSLGVETSSQVFRVTKVTDDDKDEIEIEALEIPGTVRSAAVYNWQATAGYNANFGEPPGSVQAPAFIEAYGAIISATGGRQLWIAVGGPNNDAAWGGCQVFMSFDGTTYDSIGIVTGPARYGTISSNVTAVVTVPDTTTTMGVALNNQLDVLGTGTAADALANRLLIAVGSGASLEIMSYETASLVSAGDYNLTTLYRGLYGTTITTHSSGAQFIRLDGNILAMDIDPGWLGQTLYFKFCSFNTAGRATESLSSVTQYNYTLGQSLVAYNIVSSATFSASGSAVVYSPTTAFKMTTAASAWDSSVYSAQSYTNGSTVTAYASQTNANIMIGLTVNPTASNNYPNLAYAWYAEATGNLGIYEGGGSPGTFGTYTINDQLSIIYDGKHVAYYHNGALIRSVPIANQIFFAQICFYTPGGSVYGLNYENIATAVTPFTMVPMSVDVACAGTTALSNNQNATPGWGSRNFKSAESYTNGVQVSFLYGTPTAITYNLATLGFASAPATGGSSPGSNCVAAWYMVAQSSEVSALLGTTTVYTLLVGPTSSDVYTITYDNFTFRWWKNGALEHQEYLPNQGALYLFGDFNQEGLEFNNISFSPYGLLSPNPFITTGGCTTHDSTAIKATGSTGWDSSVYSLNAYTTCHLQFKTSNLTGQFMFGLNTDPTTNASYTSIDYAWYMDAGTWYIFESGTNEGSQGAAAVTDLALITYDGTTVTYYLNGVSQRTVTNAGKTFYADSSFYTLGAACNSLSFGPGAVPDTVPTASIDPNAATAVYSTTVSTSGNVTTGTIGNSTGNSTQQIASLTVPALGFATTDVVTATGFCNHNAGTGVQTSTAASITTLSWIGLTIAYGYNTIARNPNTSDPYSQTSFALENSFSNPGTSSVTYYFSAEMSSNGAGNSSVLSGVTFKVEQIKR